jgi:hypothetical protein
MEQASKIDRNANLCNQVIQDRLLSDEYYLETLPEQTNRKRISRSQEDDDPKGGA